MALTIVFGASGTGKSRYLLEQVKQAAVSGRRALYIVPEQLSHVAETELIQCVGYLSPEISATSFARLARRVLTELGQTGKHLGAPGKAMLMTRVLHRLGPRLSLFRQAAQKPGYSQLLLDIITEFKKAEITPQRLAALTDQPGRAPRLGQKLLELCEIYQLYQNYLEAGFWDADDDLTRLAHAMREHGLFRDTQIFLDSFFRFTAAELSCIRSMLENGAEVTAAICTPSLSAEEGSLFAPAIRTAQTLLALAREAGAAVLPAVEKKEAHRFTRSPELRHFAQEYPNRPAKAYSGRPKRVCLAVRPGPYEEMTAVAARIRRFLMEEGCRYRDIAVIAGNFEEYRDIARTVFPMYDIPVFTDERSDLLRHPVLLMLGSVFDMVTGGFRTEDVLTYIKSGLVGVPEDLADRLENYALAGRIQYGDWLNDQRFLQRADMVFSETEEEDPAQNADVQELVEAKNRLMAPVVRLREEWSASRCVRDRAAALSAFLEQLSLKEQISEQVDRLTDQGELQLAEIYAGVYNLLMEALDQLVLCMGEEDIGLEKLREVLLAGFREQSVGVIPPAGDQVFFGDLGRSLVKNVRALFVVGAVDGTFPPAVGAEGLLTDADRIELAQEGVHLAPDRRRMAFENQFVVYQGLTVSREWLLVSCPAADAEGRGLRPSALFGRLRRLFPELSMEPALPNGRLTARQSVASRQSAFQYVLSGERDALREELAGWLKQDPDSRERLNRIRTAAARKNTADRLSAEAVEALYPGGLTGSVSRFERFAACPFSYFVEYGLRAKERRVMRVEAPDIGRLLHGLLDRFFKTAAERGMRIADLTEEDCGALADELLDGLSGRMFIANLYSEKKLSVLLGRLRRLLLRSVWALCEHVRRGAFEPCAFEVAFGADGEMPPVEISLPDGRQIRLAGRIDRIDRYSDGTNLYIKIIDYKSGSKTFSLSDVYHGLSLQLAIYLTAAAENGSELFGEQPRPAGMFYFRLQDPILEAEAPAKEDKEALLKKYKMSGLVLDDSDIIRAMDSGISGYSKVIPVRFNQSGETVRKNSSSATAEQFGRLLRCAKRAAARIGGEILAGNVEILPARDGKTLPCEYCKYHSICAREERGGAVRKISSMPTDEIWEKLREEEENSQGSFRS